MGTKFPQPPDADGDEPALSPGATGHRSLVGAERNTDKTRRLETDDKRNLFVNIAVISAVSAPPGTTPIDINIFGDVSSTAGIDTFFVITSGKTLTIQALSGGSEFHSSGSVVELFHDPDADLGVNLERIETIFVNGDSDSVIVDRKFVGDGTARIVLRRRRYANSAREIWGRWRGFEE